jgi:hypothetical protein
MIWTDHRDYTLNIIDLKFDFCINQTQKYQIQIASYTTQGTVRTSLEAQNIFTYSPQRTNQQTLIQRKPPRRPAQHLHSTLLNCALKLGMQITLASSLLSHHAKAATFPQYHA